MHDAGLDDRRTRPGVDRDDPGEVLDGVNDVPGPTALPAMEVPAPRMVIGTLVASATSRIASSLSAGARPHDHLRTTR